MRKIKEYVDKIEEELNDAKEYAERYLSDKADGNTTTKYKQMAEDELKHALNLHEVAVTEIQKLEQVYNAPVEMQEAWNKSHKTFIEKTAWIRQMLQM